MLNSQFLIFILTNSESTWNPLYNHLGLFFTKDEFLIAKLNALIKRFIRNPSAVDEIGILQGLEEIKKVENLDSNSLT